MISSILFRGAAAASLLLAATLPSLSDSVLSVEINQAKILKLSRPADTIVVGNPLIADASVQDANTIVLTGKGFGQTNLVVLAEDGTPILDEQISVSRNTASTLRIYRRAEVQTLHCSPYCETALKSAAETASDKDVAESQ